MFMVGLVRGVLGAGVCVGKGGRCEAPICGGDGVIMSMYVGGRRGAPITNCEGGCGSLITNCVSIWRRVAPTTNCVFMGEGGRDVSLMQPVLEHRRPY